jgi:hypothetical protein
MNTFLIQVNHEILPCVSIVRNDMRLEFICEDFRSSNVEKSYRTIELTNLTELLDAIDTIENFEQDYDSMGYHKYPSKQEFLSRIEIDDYFSEIILNLLDQLNGGKKVINTFSIVNKIMNHYLNKVMANIVHGTN